MDHPKCETCDYFEPPKDPEHEITAHKGKGLCRYTPHSADITEWSEDLEDVVKPEFRNRTAMVVDGSGYHAALMPKPSHYCAMHSAINPTNSDKEIPGQWDWDKREPSKREDLK